MANIDFANIIVKSIDEIPNGKTYTKESMKSMIEVHEQTFFDTLPKAHISPGCY